MATDSSNTFKLGLHLSNWNVYLCCACCIESVANLLLLPLTICISGFQVGTKKKGCSGQTYTLEYVTEKSKFDEVVVQDGVQVLIDSKALFSLIGSEMDYVEDKLSAQFVFNNPNVKEMCGCGQSFMT
ncbi:hypothetical protein BDEG_24236 [Batrachochytrium dendrobatidis JEL423]|uniref:Core domain-containing protein n=1 Tax=Batrachochytrium dendrobatidis (strain JEL423) TaxID=403673 RepID=A0A177WKA8_BATDL|nr:hypothetical protein BDEG_24236 [Batrachochytrium dendrobatidis JEL423]